MCILEFWQGLNLNWLFRIWVYIEIETDSSKNVKNVELYQLYIYVQTDRQLLIGVIALKWIIWSLVIAYLQGDIDLAKKSCK